jgi:hypothetical protein
MDRVAGRRPRQGPTAQPQTPGPPPRRPADPCYGLGCDCQIPGATILSPTSLRDLIDQAVSHESLPAPIDWRLRRFAWLGVLLLAALVLYLWGTWRLLDLADQARPTFILIGWGLLRDTIRLQGHAQAAYQAAVALLGAATVVAAATKGFRAGRIWGQLGSFAVGVGGLLAAAPLGVAAAVVAANLVAWVAATLIAMLFVVALQVFAVLFVLALLVRLALGRRR